MGCRFSGARDNGGQAEGGVRALAKGTWFRARQQGGEGGDGVRVGGNAVRASEVRATALSLCSSRCPYLCAPVLSLQRIGADLALLGCARLRLEPTGMSMERGVVWESAVAASQTLGAVGWLRAGPLSLPRGRASTGRLKRLQACVVGYHPLASTRVVNS